VSLQQQIAAMTAKDTFILTIPPKPFRCPPGPYERACVVADYLQREKEGGTVVILDANPEIQAGAKIFNAAYSDTFKDIITYVPNATLESIDADKGTVKTSAGSFNGTVINAIPAQKAGKLITTSDLKLASQGGRWAGVDVLTYESTVIPKVHIIGDSSATTQPKAGHIANAEAKVCADAILNLLQGKAVNQNPITNSACYSPITQDTAAWMSVVFRYDPESKTMKPSKAGIAESNKASERNHKEMMKWFNNLMSDTFA
jgi:NADPH-dependent 2,4-dienoyl-CoA reductase/sulfur reductase-like enzyme